MASAKSKAERETRLGRHVEMRSGERIFVKPWGFDEQQEMFAVLLGIMQDAKGLDLEGGEDAIRHWAIRNWNRIKTLVAASCEHGEADLKKVVGLDGTIDLIEAVIEQNGVVEAVGKLRSKLGEIKLGNLRQAATEALRKEGARKATA